MLRGKQPFVSRTAAPGCLITRLNRIKPDHTVTYSSHIAAIIQDNCQKCHRLRQIAPFPLTGYEEVAGWSAMIHSVLTDDRMPPWNASRDFDGVFVNQRRIPDQDKQMILAWIEGGMPRGNPEEDPQPREWPKDWRIGKPDKIYKMPKSFQVPAEGVVEYQFFGGISKFKL